MTRSPLLLILLVTALGLVDLSVFRWITAASTQLAPIRPPHPMALLMIALAVSQVGLLAIWLAMDNGKLLVKLFANLGMLWIWSFILGRISLPEQAWLRILFSQAFFVFLIMVILRYRSLFLQRKFLTAILSTNDYRTQFSLAGLMQWMTGISLLMIVMRKMDFRLFDSTLACGGCLLFAVTTCLCAWASSQERHLALRAGIPLIAIPTLGALFARVDTSLPAWSYAVLTGMIAILLSLALATIRAGEILPSVTHENQNHGSGKSPAGVCLGSP